MSLQEITNYDGCINEAVVTVQPYVVVRNGIIILHPGDTVVLLGALVTVDSITPVGEEYPRAYKLCVTEAL